VCPEDVGRYWLQDCGYCPRAERITIITFFNLSETEGDVTFAICENGDWIRKIVNLEIISEVRIRKTKEGLNGAKINCNKQFLKCYKKMDFHSYWS
jgi:hypothetical protein